MEGVQAPGESITIMLDLGTKRDRVRVLLGLLPESSVTRHQYGTPWYTRGRNWLRPGCAPMLSACPYTCRFDRCRQLLEIWRVG